MRQTDRQHAACAWLEPYAFVFQVEDRLALEHVKGGFERVEVAVDVAVLERHERQAGVSRAGRAADENAAGQSRAAVAEGRRQLDLLPADEPVH